jgi:hypothetical protein
MMEPAFSMCRSSYLISRSGYDLIGLSIGMISGRDSSKIFTASEGGISKGLCDNPWPGNIEMMWFKNGTRAGLKPPKKTF